MEFPRKKCKANIRILWDDRYPIYLPTLTRKGVGKSTLVRRLGMGEIIDVAPDIEGKGRNGRKERMMEGMSGRDGRRKKRARC